MSDHRPLSDLMKRLPAARRARIGEKSPALNTALPLQELREARSVSQEEPQRLSGPTRIKILDSVTLLR